MAELNLGGGSKISAVCKGLQLVKGPTLKCHKVTSRLAGGSLSAPTPATVIRTTGGRERGPEHDDKKGGDLSWQKLHRDDTAVLQHCHYIACCNAEQHLHLCSQLLSSVSRQ